MRKMIGDHGEYATMAAVSQAIADALEWLVGSAAAGSAVKALPDPGVQVRCIGCGAALPPFGIMPEAFMIDEAGNLHADFGRRAVLLWNGDPSLRTCPACGKVHPPLPADFWEESADA